MPGSFQPPIRGKAVDKNRGVSQSLASNTAADTATVATLLKNKGGNVISINPEDTIAAAVKVLGEHGIGALPVVTATGELSGILSERDIVRKLAQTSGETLAQSVAENMTPGVETCTADESLVSVLRRMTDGRFRHMPVVSDGRVCGMVTIGDVVNFRLRELEHEALQLKQMIVG